jgi:hypothetical protein
MVMMCMSEFVHCAAKIMADPNRAKNLLAMAKKCKRLFVGKQVSSAYKPTT